MADRISAALAYLAANGTMMASPTSSYSMIHAPVSLYPSKFPKHLFQLGYDIATPYNLLYDAVSRDSKWLLETLEKTATADDFTGRIVDLYKQVLAEGISQPITLGIHRSDYMIHQDGDTPALRQVEFNTISVSFACLSTKVSRLHRFLRSRFDSDLSLEALPENSALDKLPLAIATAHRLYCRPGSIVLFVVQVGERNVMDQRMIEFELWERHGVPAVRLTLGEVFASCRLGVDKRLIFDPSKLEGAVSTDAAEQEVSVVYFRAGYTPRDYVDDNDWAARTLIERSLAVKCPNVAYHLAGSKKVQQALAAPGVVEKFVTGADAALIRSSFAGLWSLDPDAPEKAGAIEAACRNPRAYVLKPQREGGGNNVYNDAVKAALESMSPDQLSAHILMERIFPPDQTSHLVRNGQVVRAETVSEFGVYSVFVSDAAGGIVCNEAAGHLLRTKTVDSDEGGVAAGFAVLDSPELC